MTPHEAKAVAALRERWNLPADAPDKRILNTLAAQGLIIGCASEDLRNVLMDALPRPLRRMLRL